MSSSIPTLLSQRTGYEPQYPKRSNVYARSPHNSGSNTSGNLKNVSARLADAQKNGQRTDVTFTFVGSNEEVKAHKLVLSLGSQVFDTMFYGDSWNTGDKVELNDVDPEVFKVFIEFLYTNTLPSHIRIQTAIQVMYVATKYCVESLRKSIEKFLKDSITLETVFPILKTALLFQARDLELKCWECVEMDTDRIVFTEEFILLDRDLLGRVLDRESLAISEIKLFDAILRWADSQCKRQGITSVSSNIQLVLGDILKKIRFPAMDATEFANGPAASGLLSQEEISNALLTKFSTVEKIRPMFSPHKRAPKKQFNRLECRCKSIKNPVSCSFCEDRNVPTQDTLQIHGKNCWQLQMPSPSPYCGCRTRDYCPSRRIL